MVKIGQIDNSHRFPEFKTDRFCICLSPKNLSRAIEAKKPKEHRVQDTGMSKPKAHASKSTPSEWHCVSKSKTVTTITTSTTVEYVTYQNTKKN